MFKHIKTFLSDKKLTKLNKICDKKLTKMNKLYKIYTGDINGKKFFEKFNKVERKWL